MFDVKDVSWASEMTSDRRRLLLKTKSLLVCPFPTIGFSGARINALQVHRLSISVHPIPLPMLAEGGRLAGRSSVSLQVAGARKRAASPGEARKSAGLGSQKSAPSRQIGLVLRLRLVCQPNATVFGLSQLEIWIGNQEFTFQIGHFGT
jgi:hypothetical protein